MAAGHLARPNGEQKTILDRAHAAAKIVEDYRWQDMEKYRLDIRLQENDPLDRTKMKDLYSPIAEMKRNPAVQAAFTAAGEDIDKLEFAKTTQPALPGSRPDATWYKLDFQGTKDKYKSVIGFSTFFENALNDYAARDGGPKEHFKAITSIQQSIMTMELGEAMADNL